VEIEAAAFERAEEIRSAPSRRFLHPWIFAVTLVLAALTFGRLVDPVTTLALVAVLLYHELGHFVAMKLFGYRDATIFFVPFFGAATVGRKHDATAAQQIIVLLAGPVPGLLLALGLSLVPHPP